jgi:hypothetical protein
MSSITAAHRTGRFHVFCSGREQTVSSVPMLGLMWDNDVFEKVWRNEQALRTAKRIELS